MEIKMKKTIATFILMFNLNYIEADDYVWGEEFKEGDVISAATFNKIFDTLQKLNRTPVDADLVGTWSCSAVEKMSSTAENVNGWSQQGFLWVLPTKQVTMTASGDNSSMISPYSLSTAAPSPFYVSNNASAGTYSLFNGMLFLNGISGSVDQYYVNIVSDDRFVLQGVTSGGTAVPDFIICDSAIAVPASPTTTIATNAQTTVNVSWTDQSSDETGFKIYRRLSSETEATQLATAVAASPYVDSTLTEGQTAYYSVSAYNANGESAKSKVVSATLDSIPPTVSATDPQNNDTVSRQFRNIVATFSEKVELVCPAGDQYTMMDCPSSSYAITFTALIEGGNREVGLRAVTLGTGGSNTITLTTMGSAERFDANQNNITATVNKDWVRDSNGIQMNQDFQFKFNVDDSLDNPSCPPSC